MAIHTLYRVIYLYRGWRGMYIDWRGYLGAEEGIKAMEMTRQRLEKTRYGPDRASR